MSVVYQTVSLSSALVEGTMTGNKKVMCKVCYREMRSDVLTRHMKQHSKRNESNPTTNIFVTNRAYDLIEEKQTHMVKSAKDKQASITHKKQNAQEYLCDECGELFSAAWELERHVKRTHKLTFMCDLCKFETEDKQASIIHKKQHTQEYYQCDHCNKTLKCRKSLLRHVREQHEIQRFSCSHCNYQTNRKYQLSEHKKTHMVNISTPKPKKSITSQNMEQQTVTQPTSPSEPSNHDEENVPHFVTHWGGLTVYISGYPRLGKIDCMKL